MGVPVLEMGISRKLCGYRREQNILLFSSGVHHWLKKGVGTQAKRPPKIGSASFGCSNCRVCLCKTNALLHFMTEHHILLHLSASCPFLPHAHVQQGVKRSDAVSI